MILLDRKHQRRKESKKVDLLHRKLKNINNVINKISISTAIAPKLHLSKFRRGSNKYF